VPTEKKNPIGHTLLTKLLPLTSVILIAILMVIVGIAIPIPCLMMLCIVLNAAKNSSQLLVVRSQMSVVRS
jgi:hypothetical protein